MCELSRWCSTEGFSKVRIFSSINGVFIGLMLIQGRDQMGTSPMDFQKTALLVEVPLFHFVSLLANDVILIFMTQ